MIKIESVYIEETRGIRKLEVNPKGENYSISGPNGSGKSGVVDAIEFGLTGDIKRLAGSGTRGLSVLEHGPDVDKVKFPDASFVKLKVHLTALGKSVEIKRNIKTPKEIEIVPDEPDIRAALEDVAAHPEITLSRRDIIRFILVGPTERSKEIQALLKLNQLGDTRSALNTANNSLKRSHQVAATNRDSLKQQLQLHLQVERLTKKQLLDIVNKNRTILNLEEISELTNKTQLDKDLSTQGVASKFNKTSAVASIEAARAYIANIGKIGKKDSQIILETIEILQKDTVLLTMIQQKALVEIGLELIQDANCPLCDKSWPSEAELKAHLHGKLQKSLLADQLSKTLLDSASNLTRDISELSVHLISTNAIANQKEIGAKEDSKVIESMLEDLKELRTSLISIDNIIALKARMEAGWLNAHLEIVKNIDSVDHKVAAMPDQSMIVSAQTFLSTAQLRLNDYWVAKRANDSAEESSKHASFAYETYCEVMEAELTALYEEVQEDFSSYYRELNENDEDAFSAKFTPSEGSLALEVNFYERGLFPPGAYHSEGHQDGMGVCLYLALMKRLFGNNFSFALLDDVVMSVDSGHRYQFCKLLKSKFPDTQFILTTHDRVWAKQMNSAKLVTSKNSLEFHSWSVETGPLVASGKEIWTELDSDLAKGNVESAAHSLRRHLEYFANHQCDQLGASVQYRADGNYDLGALLPAAQKRMKAILGSAMTAAHSWGDDLAKAKTQEFKKSLSDSSTALQVDQWVINPAVHYNEWANFGKTDFIPILSACRSLVECFECKKCESWVYVTPKFKPESLRCTCGDINLNLNNKPK